MLRGNEALPDCHSANAGCTYDAAGRTTSVTSGGQTTTVAYDYEDRITSITYPSTATNTFTYNGLDTRVGKVDSAGTKTYKRDGAGVTDAVLSDGAANYTPGVSERRSEATAFRHADRMGSMTRLTNSSQSTTDTRTYDAFGLLVASTGSTATPFGFVRNQGYQSDSDSGLMLLGHRYYDPSTGRFLTRDRAKDGRNWYLYCDGNPLRFLDSGGSEIKIVGFSSKMRRKVQKQLQQVRRVFPHILDFEEHVNPHLLSDGGGQTLRIKWMRT